MNRDRGGFDDRADAAFGADVPQVARESVAEVDHRARATVLGDLAGEQQARLEREVTVAMQRAAERAGDVDEVAGFRAAARQRRDAGASAEDRDGDDELAVPRARVAADDLTAERIGGVAQAEVELFGIFDRSAARQ